MSNRLFISFSGGRTSAYLTKRLLDLAAQRNDGTEIRVLFSNSSQEDERTLRFVDRCDKHFGFNTVWVEAVVTPEKGVGTSFKVVDFATASRQGEPFEAVIQKYGIPNKNFPHCTRELKLNPMRAYLKSIGWETGSYDTAIGIRADEGDRISASARENRIIYPLVRWGVKKEDVLSWWAVQPFDLELPEHFGNCVGCWKKSDRKLMTVAKERPEAFAFFDRMERTYPDAGPGDFDRPRRFFRQSRSAQEMLTLSTKPFVPYTPDTEVQLSLLDLGGGCGESCEVWADGMEAAE